MPNEILNLNTCCPTFGTELTGDRLNQIIALLNDLKLRQNGHTHTVNDGPPTSALVTAAAVTALSSIDALNLLCAFGTIQGGAGSLLDKIVTLANEMRTDFNAHGHSAFGVVATEQLSAPAPIALTAAEQEIGNSVCISLNEAQIGTRLEAIITLLIEIRADYNAHQHPAVITAASDQTIVAADVTLLV